MAITYIAAAFGISFFLTYFAIPPIVTIADEKEIFDMPNSRRLNKTAIPAIGGIAIFFGWVITSLLCLHGNFEDGMQYLFLGMLLMFFVGLKDDIITIVAWKKFAIQLCVAIMLTTIGGFRITTAYGFFGAEVLDYWVSVPLSIVLILFLINAVNLIDGIDGLSSGLSIVISSCLGIWLYSIGEIGYALACFALIGSLVAFLRFNLSKGKNKTFMGDTGSLVLGTFLSTVAIYFSNNAINAEVGNLAFRYPPVMALALFIVPVTDTLYVFFIRIISGHSPFTPDMNHFHHRLIGAGMTHIQGTCFLIAYTLLFVLLAYLCIYLEIEITVSFYLILSLSFVVTLCIRKLLSAIAKRKKISP